MDFILSSWQLSTFFLFAPARGNFPLPPKKKKEGKRDACRAEDLVCGGAMVLLSSTPVQYKKESLVALIFNVSISISFIIPSCIQRHAWVCGRTGAEE